MVKSIAIVSLSAGTLGEEFVRHEVKIGLKRLEEYGLEIKIMPHAMKGIEYVSNHPEDRAKDLMEAFQDEETDMILCAIGGNDTYRLLPYLFGQDELKKTLKQKIFLGFSDSTMNHLMLHKVGLPTFYGQSFLADICELDKEMLPYTKYYFEELIKTGTIKEIKPSDVWYEERTDWSINAIGTKRVEHKNSGFELLQGAPVFKGKILGGCLETLYSIFDDCYFKESVTLCEKYQIFPSLEDWKGRILLLETSQKIEDVEEYRKMLMTIKQTGIFDVVSGILCGKAVDEINYEEYKKSLVEIVGNKELPIVANVNIGHATPRSIIPFGVEATVDVMKQRIIF